MLLVYIPVGGFSVLLLILSSPLPPTSFPRLPWSPLENDTEGIYAYSNYLHIGRRVPDVLICRPT